MLHWPTQYSVPQSSVYSLQSTVSLQSTALSVNSHNATESIKAAAKPPCSSAAHKRKFVLLHINLRHCTSVCGATIGHCTSVCGATIGHCTSVCGATIGHWTSVCGATIGHCTSVCGATIGHCTSVCGATVVPTRQVCTHIRLLLWRAEN